MADGGAGTASRPGRRARPPAWMYLRLLVARRAIDTVLARSEGADDSRSGWRALERSAARRWQRQDLRRSLTGQVEILRQRLAQQARRSEKLAYLEAELTRIEEQVELIREQAALSTDPELLSHASIRSRPRSAAPRSGFAISSRCTARWRIC